MRKNLVVGILRESLYRWERRAPLSPADVRWLIKKGVKVEVESSKVPSYIICCDSEGMSVLTAWAAEKFTAEKIADTLKKCGIETISSHKKVTIPGYVSVLSGKLEEASGWKVSVGPREASGIVNYLRNWKS